MGHNTDSERLLLSVEETAERLGINRSAAWRLVQTGDLRSVKIGRLRRVSTRAIAEFIAHAEGRGDDTPAA